MRRRQMLAVGAACALPFPLAFSKEAYPTRAVSIISGYAPGGPVDIFGRLAAQHFSSELGGHFVVESRPGASGTIAGEAVARAAPDGYTLLVTVPSLFTMVPFMMEGMRVSHRDFMPIGQIAEAPMVLLCHPDVPAATAREFIDLVRKDASLSFASAGTGTLPHLAAELLLSRLDAKALHVPYKGSAAALQDLTGGQIQFATDNVAPAVPLIKAGRLRALAVTSSARFPGLPEVPTLAESGVEDFSATNWFGIFAPAGTPEPIAGRLADAMKQMASSEAFQSQVRLQGASPVSQGPDETRQRIEKEAAQWGPLIKSLNIRTG